MLRLSRQTALAAIFLFAGCGSPAESPPSLDSAARSAARSAAMKVAPVDGRVGDATAATSGSGIERLKVRRGPSDPGRAREGVGAGASCADVDLMPAPDNLPAVAAATMCLVNGERVDAGLPPLATNARLAESSLAHSLDMVARTYFAHQGLDGSSVVDRTRAVGYLVDDLQWTVGENLAWGTGTMATPISIVQAWMASQGHRENILRTTFQEAGLGIALGNPISTDGEGATYTMNFGTVPQRRATGRTAGAPAPRTSSAARRAAVRRAVARRLKSCRARARKARPASLRKARLKRCARAGRRASRRLLATR